MIEFIPKSLCSWDFAAIGVSSGTATIEYDWLTEQGLITSGDQSLDIRKHGAFSGHWTLERSGRVVAEAQKLSAISRRHLITAAALDVTLQASSAFGRAFEIVVANEVVGRVAPMHAFTRRATMTCSDAVPEHLQLFAFWLVGLMWKRSANNNSSAGA